MFTSGHFYIDLDFNPLKYCKEAPDVTLIVEGTEISAHRSVLSERCEYFRTMFASSFIEAKSNRIVLKEIKLHAFKVVLKFIYTGDLSTLYRKCYVPFCKHETHCITPEQLFEVLHCAQYYMIDNLTDDTTSKLKWKCSFNPGQVLSNALAYSVDELVTQSTSLIQKNAHNLVVNKIYEQLTSTAWEHLFNHRLDTYESIIFKALVSWMRRNSDHSEFFPHFLKNVELHLLGEKHLDMLFKPTQLIDPIFLDYVLHQQQKQKQKVLKIVDQNIINADNLRIIDGTKNCIYVRQNVGEATITPLFPKDIIVIDLKQRFLLNCVKIDSVFSNSYIVSVSTDSQNWDLVIDHSKNEGSGPQDLYFEERILRFIRIQSDAKYFNISANIEACYSTDASRFEMVDSYNAHSVPINNNTWSEMFKKLLYLE